MFFNRDPNLWIGGDMTQLNNTRQGLEKWGVETDFSCDPHVSLEGIDLVHVFHVNFEWDRAIIERLRAQNVPYVISAIFYPNVYDTTFAEIRSFVDNSRATLVNSEDEAAEMVKLTGCNADKVKVIPNGVDKSIFHPSKQPKVDRVLSVGRLIPEKGGALLFRACQQLGIPLCLVGDVGESQYAALLKSSVSEHYSGLNAHQMALMYQTSRLYVCPSLSERQSVSVLEAAACGLPIVDSVYNRGRNLLPSSIIVDPYDTDALCRAIQKQWEATNEDDVPSWDDIARQIIKIYEY